MSPLSLILETTEISVIYTLKHLGLVENSILTPISKKLEKIRKKTWDLIREAIGSDPAKPKIDKLSVSDRSVDDLKQIPNEFNKFFHNSWQKYFWLLK